MIIIATRTLTGDQPQSIPPTYHRTIHGNAKTSSNLSMNAFHDHDNPELTELFVFFDANLLASMANPR